MDVSSLTSTRSGTKFAGISYINYLFLIVLLIKYQRVPMVCLRISILYNSNLHIVSFVII